MGDKISFTKELEFLKLKEALKKSRTEEKLWKRNTCNFVKLK